MRGERIHTLAGLMNAAAARKAVTIDRGPARMPAAFVISMRAYLVHRYIEQGIYLYVSPGSPGEASKEPRYRMDMAVTEGDSTTVTITDTLAPGLTRSYEVEFPFSDDTVTIWDDLGNDPLTLPVEHLPLLARAAKDLAEQ